MSAVAGAAERPVVAVVGLGAMGGRLAANLLTESYRLVVANRTSAAADRLAAAGAVVATSPRDAAARADVVLVAVSDDHASRAVWTDPRAGLLQGLRPGGVAVECSTVSPGWVRELDGLARASGARFLEAPMIGSRPQVEARGLVHLVGGAQDVLKEVGEVLAVSAARVHHCGETGTAATTKLLVNALLATQVATLAELLGMAERSGLALDTTLELLAGLPVTSPAAARAGGSMVRGAFDPNFPVDLVAKDLLYLTELAARLDGAAPMTATALEGFRRASGDGRGQQDLTAIARSYLLHS